MSVLLWECALPKTRIKDLGKKHSWQYLFSLGATTFTLVFSIFLQISETEETVAEVFDGRLGYVPVENEGYAHIGSKQYQCGFCSVVMKTRQKIIQHIRSHTGERPFGCPMCDRDFPRKYQLKKHCLGNHKLDIPEFYKMIAGRFDSIVP